MRYFLSIALLVAATAVCAAQDREPADQPARDRSPRGETADGPKPEALDRLHALPKPPEQKDLDTLRLASAHRERAASMQEKTDGLWQSWLVSVCAGCGPERRPFSDKDADEYLRKLRSQAPAGPAHGAPDRPRYTYTSPSGAEAAGRSVNTAADLGTSSIERIRRDPNRP